MSVLSPEAQPDFLATLADPAAPVGHLFWFTVGPEGLDQAAWIQAIHTAGLAAYGLPGPIPPATAFHRALGALRQRARDAGVATLLRRVERRRGTETWHWIRETVAGGQARFTPIAAITWATATASFTTQRLDALATPEEAAFQALPELAEAAGRTYTPGDRRRQVLRWLQPLDPLGLEHAGPVRFVPAGGTPLLETLVQAGPTLGLQAWMLPLARSQAVADTLAAALTAEVQAKAARLMEDAQALEDLASPRAQRWIAAFQALDARVRHYAHVLETHQDAIRHHLDLVRQTLRAKTALS